MLIDGQNGSFLAHPDKSLLLKPVTTLSSALDMRTIERAANQGELLALKLNGVEKFSFHCGTRYTLVFRSTDGQ